MPVLLPVRMPSVILLGSDNSHLANDNTCSIWICLSTIGYPPACMHPSLYFGSANPFWDFSRHESPYFPHMALPTCTRLSTHLDNIVSLLDFKNLSLRDCFSDFTWTLIPHGRLLICVVTLFTSISKGQARLILHVDALCPHLSLTPYANK